jgi:NitT/TauT family transport system substrate-binding protein
MLMRIRSIIFLLTVFSGPCSAGLVHAQNLTPMRVRLEWTPWGMEAPFFLAVRKGWFSKAGLDVYIENGNGSMSTVEIVAANDSFDMGVATSASVMIAREKGLPVRLTAEIVRKNDLGLVVHPEPGVNRLSDLKGKQIAYTANSMEAPFVDAFFKAGGLNRDQIKLINMDATAKVGSYLASRVDAVFSPIPQTLPVLSAKDPGKVFAFANFGLQMPSFGLFAKESTIEGKRDAVMRLSSVVADAWQYIFAGHEQEGADAVIAERPQARLDRATLVAQIEALRPYIVPPAGSHDRIGIPSAADYAAAIVTLSSVNLLRASHLPEEFFAPGMVRPDVYHAIVDGAGNSR